MDRFLFTFFNGEVMWEYLPKILSGMWVTTYLAAFVIVTGLALGLLLALLRSILSQTMPAPLSWLAEAVRLLIIFFVDLMRSVPPLVLIVLFFYGLPALGLDIAGLGATWLALSLVLAAFAEEIYWAGLVAVAKGQWEAARSTGLGFLQTLLYVILPQAIRLTIPPLTNRTIAITKGTALGQVVAVQEILYQAYSGLSFSSNPSPLTLGALAYLALFLPVVVVGRWIETRFAWRR
ncbi:amino acid ABC transporter permease [Reyranella sp. CPCC 100927]|uniref:amino acid ABC transporter permease n=1 Tax=Reyranella sp. CPCC 100927 TaxID=2599616 RepID=UPI0011B803A5|nr:ABC transporter permease subunit [Reyranella sp. CPCC 100927]TWT10843.1 ABC transporter permease subunit [Reyranella sp. CPCC 100927]